MQTKTLFVYIALAAFLFLHSIIAQDTPSNKEILAMLPQSTDMLDLQEIENLKRIVNLGDKVYPVLIQELSISDDPVIQGRIISIFVSSKGDKTLPANAIRESLKKWNGSSRDDVNLTVSAIEALGAFGRLQDTDILFEKLSDKNPRIVAISLDSLGKTGDGNTIDKLEQWVSAYSQRSTLPEVTRKSIIADAHQAIQAIKTRLDGQATRLQNSEPAILSSPQPAPLPVAPSPSPLPVPHSPPPIAEVASNPPFPFILVFAVGALVLLGILYLVRRKQ